MDRPELHRFEGDASDLDHQGRPHSSKKQRIEQKQHFPPKRDSFGINEKISQAIDRALMMEPHHQSDAVQGETTTASIVDKILAFELSTLDAAEREAATLDVHGVSKLIEETSELIETSLKGMGIALEELLNSDIRTEDDDMQELRRIYEMAQQQDPSYLEDRCLRLTFLRATKFEVHDAAMKLLEFLKLKADLFGPSLLCKEISMQDDDCFSAEDRKCLQSGLLQTLVTKDSIGRTVFIWSTTLRGHYQPTSKQRLLLYTMMAAIRDIECQQKGCVFVLLNCGSHGVQNRDSYLEGTSKMHKLILALPVRFNAFHICTDQANRQEYAALTIAKSMNRHRIRARHHEGSSLDEIKQKLMSFGIPCYDEVFPMKSFEDVDLSHHRRWCEKQLLHDLFEEHPAADPTSSSSGKDIIPGARDVLFGRSSSSKRHLGNVFYYSLLDLYEDAYERCHKSVLTSEKGAIASHIVQIIQDTGGRFLRLASLNYNGSCKNRWSVVDARDSRKKVTNAFRDRRKMKKELSSAEVLSHSGHR